MSVYKNKKTGKWYTIYRYTDWEGKRRQKKKEGFKTRKEAQQYEREALAKESGNINMSFKALADLYFADCETRLRQTTILNKKILFDTKLIPYFGDTPVCEITPQMIRKWQNTLLSDPANYAATYLKTINNQLSAIMNYAIRYYGLPTNPVVACGPFGKKTASDMQFWTREEFHLFIDAIKNKPASQLAFELLYWTGMRLGELLALTFKDIDFEKSEININKSLSRVAKKDIILPPKTPKSKRIVTIPKFLLDLVKDYKGRLVDCEPADRIITISRRTLQDEMKRGCAASGVKRIRIHDLRHSHASLLIELGFSPQLAAERLGHESITTTLQTYSHLYPNKQVEVSNRLDADEAENYSGILSAFEKK